MADFGNSLANLMAAVSLFRVEDYKQQIFVFSNMKGSILSKSRFLLVEEAKKFDADYLFFIDSDQTFPRKTFHVLMRHDLDVVGANVATKTLPAQPTARNKGPSFAQNPQDWSLVYTDENSKGVEKVDRLGCGVLLLSKNAYKSLEPQDWNTYWRGDVEAFQGEDWTMMDALEAKGFDVYVDHDVSQEVGHVGFFTFKHEHVGETIGITEEELARVRDPISRPIAKAIAAL